jgi:hypothetical protein
MSRKKPSRRERKSPPPTPPARSSPPVPTKVTGRHADTYASVFAEPILANIAWSDIESMFRSVGVVSEREGSRIAVNIGGRVAVFHRPHPGHEASKPVVRSVRQYLQAAGVTA